MSPMEKASALKREHKELRALIRDHLAEMDSIMKEPSTVERGKKIARAMNLLELTLDRIEHFGITSKPLK
jgi:hypothetical protein